LEAGGKLVRILGRSRTAQNGEELFDRPLYPEDLYNSDLPREVLSRPELYEHLKEAARRLFACPGAADRILGESGFQWFEPFDEVLRLLGEPKSRVDLPADVWEFSAGYFRYKTVVWHPLHMSSLRLLQAFVHATNMTLTHDEINLAASCDSQYPADRPYAHISELNKALRTIWNLKDNPIKSIRNADAARLQLPR
jgi:hypothetical protein